MLRGQKTGRFVSVGYLPFFQEKRKRECFLSHWVRGEEKKLSMVRSYVGCCPAAEVLGREGKREGEEAASLWVRRGGERKKKASIRDVPTRKARHRSFFPVDFDLEREKKGKEGRETDVLFITPRLDGGGGREGEREPVELSKKLHLVMIVRGISKRKKGKSIPSPSVKKREGKRSTSCC